MYINIYIHICISVYVVDFLHVRMYLYIKNELWYVYIYINKYICYLNVIHLKLYCGSYSQKWLYFWFYYAALFYLSR